VLTILSTAAGGALIAVVLRDIFLALFAPRSRGGFSSRLAHSLWRTIRRSRGLDPASCPWSARRFCWRSSARGRQALHSAGRSSTGRIYPARSSSPPARSRPERRLSRRALPLTRDPGHAWLRRDYPDERVAQNTWPPGGAGGLRPDHRVDLLDSVGLSGPLTEPSVRARGVTPAARGCRAAK
jgi:hypothetical protein